MNEIEMSESFPPTKEDIVLFSAVQLKENTIFTLNDRAFSLDEGDWIVINHNKCYLFWQKDLFCQNFGIVCECDKDESVLLANEGGFPQYFSNRWVYVTEIDSASIN